jgi:hypothetical protein
MAEKWELTVYCDKCHAGAHYQGNTVGNCAYQAQREGWFQYDNGLTLCKHCQGE